MTSRELGVGSSIAIEPELLVGNDVGIDGLDSQGIWLTVTV